MYTVSLFLLLFASCTGLVYFFRFFIGTNSTDKIHHDSKRNKYKDFLFNILAAFALTVLVQTFQELTYKSSYNQERFEMSGETIDVPPCIFDIPPPPVDEQIEVIEVECLEITNDIDIELNCFDFEDEVIECFIEEEIEEEGFVCGLMFETPAQPVGGYSTFYKFVKENLKYSKQAKRQEVEGKVYVQFVVRESGKITDVKVIKGLNPSLDKEAVRVIKLSPNWKIAKQRGVPVPQKIVVPIVFKLNSDSVSDEIGDDIECEVEQIYTIVDEAAEPIDGFEKLHKKIGEKIRIPKKMQKISFEGNVYVQVIINEKGKIQDAEVTQGINPKLDKKVLKTVKKFAKKWKPAKFKGEFVKQKLIIPVKIKNQVL